MDLRVRKYVLYRVQNIERDRGYLWKLKRTRDQLRQEIIDESPDYMDGQPRGKGGTSNVTERKALKLIEIDRRIECMEKDIKAIKTAEEKIDHMGKLAKDIYTETIKKKCTNLTAKADLLEIGRRQLIQGKARLLEIIAVELGEYIDLDEEGLHF